MKAGEKPAAQPDSASLSNHAAKPSDVRRKSLIRKTEWMKQVSENSVTEVVVSDFM